MGLIYCVISFIALLIMSIVFNYDDRRPSSTEIKYRFRVKDNSIFRRIIRFKDKPYSPCIYFKIVPIYIYSLFTILSLGILLVDFLTNNILSSFLGDKAIILGCVTVLGLHFLYLSVLIIWWEVVDNKEMKLTKKEKNKLKNTRKRKE